ncbi:Crp/Fnr family transcriptional regulator [Aliiroseovarius sp. 2305UL8-7]|uniref:Crp/Fnr family transcriptional regulator n=1 Tax=Aliiroseovarius conchicola TaxID=3121637 RepID=UPI0035297A82
MLKKQAGLRSKQTCVQGARITTAKLDQSELCFLWNGALRSYRITQDGREITTDLTRSTNSWRFVGICSKLHHLEALTDCEYVSLDAKAAAHLLLSNPDQLEPVLCQVLEKFEQSHQQLEDLTCNDVTTRLARVLSELCEDFGETDGASVHLTLPMSQDRLASMVSASRPTVNISLRQLRSLGLLTYAQGRIQILEPDRLRSVWEDPTVMC